MRKILLILHLPPPVHGASVIGENIKSSMQINTNHDTSYINLSLSTRIEDIGDRSIKKLFPYLSLIWRVNKSLVKFRPEICYITPSSRKLGFYKDAPIIFLSKFYSNKSILHFHNKGIKSANGIFSKIFYKIVFKNTDVILLSKNLYNDIEEYVPHHQVHYCPNGIPDNFGVSTGLIAESHKSLNLSLPKGTSHSHIIEILFVSNLIESKGVFILLASLKILKSREILFHCTMIGGDGDIKIDQVKEKVQELGISDNVTIAGKKFNGEKNYAFKSADIFVHPTFDDCLPLVILEAMQHSLPVVSTFEGAIPEVVENGITGFLVPQRETEALADKLEILIQDPELRIKMGQAGRSKYEREYTIERFEKRIVEIFNKVAAGE